MAGGATSCADVGPGGAFDPLTREVPVHVTPTPRPRHLVIFPSWLSVGLTLCVSGGCHLPCPPPAGRALCQVPHAPRGQEQSRHAGCALAARPVSAS